MPSVELKEASADFDVPFRSLASSLRLNLDGSKRVLKLKHRHPSNAASLEAAIPGWTFNYDLTTKEAVVEHKRTVRLGSLSIKQRIPYQKLYLVPSPELKLAFKPAYFLKDKVRSETTLSYNYLTSTGKVEQLLASKSRYKASIIADTATGCNGASLELSAKVNHPHLSSVGLDLSRARGPVVKAEASLLSGVRTTKLKADYRVRSKEAKLDVTPPAVNKVRWIFTSIIKTDKPAARPSLLVGATLAL